MAKKSLNVYLLQVSNVVRSQNSKTPERFNHAQILISPYVHSFCHYWRFNQTQSFVINLFSRIYIKIKFNKQRLSNLLFFNTKYNQLSLKHIYTFYFFLFYIVNVIVIFFFSEASVVHDLIFNFWNMRQIWKTVFVWKIYLERFNLHFKNNNNYC